MKHTPTPWHQHFFKLGDATAIKAGDRAIAELYDSEFISTSQRIANAAFIVRACNAHGEMYSALLGVRAMLKEMGQQIPAMIDNAITIAEGGSVPGVFEGQGLDGSAR